MLAVSFFFVLIGGSLLFTGVIGLFLQLLGGGGNSSRKKWACISAGGFVSLILGFLMAMT